MRLKKVALLPDHDAPTRLIWEMWDNTKGWLTFRASWWVAFGLTNTGAFIATFVNAQIRSADPDCNPHCANGHRHTPAYTYVNSYADWFLDW